MLHRLAVACVAVALFAGLSASRAKADGTNVVTTTTVDNFLFTLSGGSTYAWTIPVPAQPVIGSQGGTAFDLLDPSYSYDGQAATSATLMEFYTPIPDGFVFLGGAGPDLSVDGPSLFAGSPVSDPVFNLGTFTDYTDKISGQAATLVVTQTTTPVATPEPGTLLLTGIGVLALFWVARKKKALNLAA
ncbi:MAG TPA: PEP-CTERM sorting domain-containing protein [Candidatus Acidoferrales bacterium]